MTADAALTTGAALTARTPRACGVHGDVRARIGAAERSSRTASRTASRAASRAARATCAARAGIEERHAAAAPADTRRSAGGGASAAGATRGSDHVLDGAIAPGDRHLVEPGHVDAATAAQKCERRAHQRPNQAAGGSHLFMVVELSESRKQRTARASPLRQWPAQNRPRSRAQ